MDVCKHDNCNNEVEWLDEPDDFCSKHIGLMADDCREFLEEENENNDKQH